VVCQTGASLLPLLKPTSKILDVGCGSGRFLQTLFECGNVPAMRRENIYGVDFSAAHVRMANEKWALAEPHFFVADMTDLRQFQDQTFDIVLSFSTFFYLKDVSLVTRALSEFARVTKDCGAIFLGDVSDAGKEQIAIAAREKSEYYSKKQVGIVCQGRY
jgi:ubiquinone/menaquinone biosynthesis C-methylase UbiE